MYLKDNVDYSYIFYNIFSLSSNLKASLLESLFLQEHWLQYIDKWSFLYLIASGPNLMVT